MFNFSLNWEKLEIRSKTFNSHASNIQTRVSVELRHQNGIFSVQSYTTNKRGIDWKREFTQAIYASSRNFKEIYQQSGAFSRKNISAIGFSGFFLLSNQDQVQVQSRDKYHEDRSSYLTTSLAKNAIYYLDLGCRLRDINSIGGEVSLNCVTSSKFLLNPRTTPWLKRCVTTQITTAKVTGIAKVQYVSVT